MRTNRSMPDCTVTPELAYPDVGAAAAWLCRAYGFEVRLRAGSDRVQLAIGDEGGAVVLVPLHGTTIVGLSHGVMVRVEDVDAHHERARREGAAILRVPADFEYGERQYVTRDLAGHEWVFSQTIEDVDPRSWGASVG